MEHVEICSYNQFIIRGMSSRTNDALLKHKHTKWKKYVEIQIKRIASAGDFLTV
jgi:hypothetical protein